MVGTIPEKMHTTMNRAIKVYYSLIIEYNSEIASIGENINRYMYRCNCVWGWRKKNFEDWTFEMHYNAFFVWTIKVSNWIFGCCQK